MQEQDFIKRRFLLSLFISLPLTGLSFVPFFLVPWLSLKIIIFLVFYFYYAGLINPVVSRLMTHDQRYDPAFKNGVYVKVNRFPYDFEIDEMMENKEGYFEFVPDAIGYVVENNGIFVWLDVGDSYIPTHINCLELLPTNYVQPVFEGPAEYIPLSQRDDE